MYTKQEASQLKHEFWTAFGQYMMPVNSAEGDKINWINYKTGEKGIHFRMEADNKKATIAIELTHSDRGIRSLYFEQFVQLKTLFRAAVEEEWNWMPAATDEHGKEVSVGCRREHM